jgi:hypothetical protein
MMFQIGVEVIESLTMVANLQLNVALSVICLVQLNWALVDVQ